MSARTKPLKSKQFSRVSRKREGTWARLVYHLESRKERCQRKNLEPIPEGARVVKLQDRTRPEVFWLVSRCPYPESARFGGGPWRATRFDDRGPSSHFNAATLRDAVLLLTGEHIQGPPYAGAGAVAFHSAR